jgi:hypothetical protein
MYGNIDISCKIHNTHSVVDGVLGSRLTMRSDLWTGLAEAHARHYAMKDIILSRFIFFFGLPE